MDFILINYLNKKIEIIIAKRDFELIYKIFDYTSSKQVIKFLNSLNSNEYFIIKDNLDFNNIKNLFIDREINYILISDLIKLFNKKFFSNINLPNNKECIFYLSLFNKISKKLYLNTKEDYIIRDLINIYNSKEKNCLIDFDKENFFEGKIVLFTGGLNFITRREAFKIIRDYKGIPVSNFSKNIDVLICGTKCRNNTKSIKKIKTEKLIESGKNIVILNEVDFFKIINNKFNNT